MATRKYDQNTYKHGSHNVICDRCAFKFKAEDVKKEWTGLYVCHDCYEPRHPSDFQKGVKDDQSVAFVRPDTTESGGTDISGNTFPPSENTTATGVGQKPDPDADGLVEGNFLLNGEVESGTVS